MRAGCPQQRTHPRFPIKSRRCGQAARSSERAQLESLKAVLAVPAAVQAPKIGQAARTQDSQLEGFKAVRAGCPQQRLHPRFPIQSFRAVRAGCPQQRTHPRFPIGRCQGGAGRLPAATNAPKIPNWKASRRCGHDVLLGGLKRCGQAARSSERTQLEGFTRRCGQAGRCSECTQDCKC